MEAKARRLLNFLNEQNQMDGWGIMDGAMAGLLGCISKTRLVLKEDGFKIKVVSAAMIALMEVSITEKFGLKF